MTSRQARSYIRLSSEVLRQPNIWASVGREQENEFIHGLTRLLGWAFDEETVAPSDRLEFLAALEAHLLFRCADVDDAENDWGYTLFWDSLLPVRGLSIDDHFAVFGGMWSKMRERCSPLYLQGIEEGLWRFITPLGKYA
jgi:hypothetical protein